ncbi:MAG: LysM peptidoglycan-binding domain-containing M23 family metallopeptidase [Anaerolineales bacterium]
MPTALLAAESTSTAAAPTATLAAETTGAPLSYLVQDGDTVSSIAAQFGLQPETVLWANYGQLFDNPDLLFPGMQLLILPADGINHQVGGTDTVDNIAAFFAADSQAIIDWPGNRIDANNPVIFAGQWLLVPGGQRFLRRRLMPNLPAYAMAVSSQEYGSGACPQNAAQQPLGDGDYGWPVLSHEVAGEAFWSAHPGVDLAVEIGEDVRAADAGLVVYSGWTNENLGYGYLVMLDHGNGDFSLYGGLSAATVLCGHTVNAGDPIGPGGAIGHPAGSFVHFEIRRGEEYLDPLELLDGS